MSFTASLTDIVRANSNGLLGKHESWARVELRDIAQILNGFAFPSSNFSKEYGFPLLRIRDILENSTETNFRGEFDPQYIVNSGDLVIGMDGDFNSGLWKGKPTLLNQRVCKVTTNGLFYELKFLNYVLPGYLSEINQATSSITVKHLSSNTISKIPLPLPPLQEQRRIVAKLEQLLTQLDAGVTELRKAQLQLKRYRQAVLKAAITGELTKKWREVHKNKLQPASTLLNDILKQRYLKWEKDQLARMTAAGKTPTTDDWKKKYQEPVAPDTDHMPTLPSGWIWSSLGQAFQVNVGATPSRKRSNYWNGNISWVSSSEVAFCRINNTRETITALGLQNTSTDLHPVGTVLLGMIGEGKTRGQAAILDIPACNSQNSAAIRVSEAELPPEYIYYFLESEYERTRKLGSGNNQPALNKSRVQAMLFPLPPRAEQKAIVQEVDRLLSITDTIQQSIQKELIQADRLRRTIFRRAFQGELVPQDPNDEPAELLLERIKVERAKREAEKQSEVESKAVYK